MSVEAHRELKKNQDLRITVMGLGHVGLPMALGLAELGWPTIGADEDSKKVASLSSGKSPFYEPGLQDLLSRHLNNGRFIPTDDLEGAIRASNVMFVCVGTPQRSNGEADLSQVESVARKIGRNLDGYKLIVEKSTVPVITARWIKKTVQRYAKVPVLTGPEGEDSGNAELEFDVASNPEFLQEGQALQNFFHPDRIVCGVESERAWEILEEIYRPLQCPVLRTDLNTAELIKHTANAFLATKISFINMVADLCEKVDADVTQVVEGIGRDPRIGPHFLSPGIGFGGYCLPKDVRAFVHMAETCGVDFSLLKEVERVNQQRVARFLSKVRNALWVLNGKVIGVLGAAFKPNTDDIREAPSLRIVEGLLAEGASLQLYDPNAMPGVRNVFPPENYPIRYCSSPYEVAEGAHAVLVLTEWEEFRGLDLLRLREAMDVPVLVDGRNVYRPEAVRAAGFEYISIGR